MVDYLGFLAASCVLLQASVRSILWIRVAALCSNVLFVVYAYMAGLPPVLALNSVLIPMNGWNVLKGIVEHKRRAEAQRLRGHSAPLRMVR
ncbi:MAG: hypothetical protein KJO30_02190 [Boseongicola sp.]|nr:hypothetical protein [Boseongicola sp.]NNJ67160.1 hypothetical protein [Boseongicola sp.]